MKPVTIVAALIAAWVTVCSSDPVKFTGYLVQRFLTLNEDQRQVLLQLENNNPGVIFLTPVSSVRGFTDVAFPPHLQTDLRSNLMSRVPRTSTLTTDLESMIDRDAMLQSASSIEAVDQSFTNYLTDIQIFDLLDFWSQEHSDVLRLVEYGRSFEGRPLNVLEIKRPGGSANKPIIMMDSITHAREWITGASLLFFIFQLLTSTDSDIDTLLDTFEFNCAPLINPDGYNFSIVSNRLWRKNRSVHDLPITQNPRGCIGTDPNRNYDFGFGGQGTSTDPCSDVYHGGEAFSTPEISAWTEYALTKRDRCVGYVSTHSYSQLVLLSYGCNRDTSPYPNFTRDLAVANAAAAALQSVSGTQYTTGNSDDILYPACGCSSDWFLSPAYGTDYSYTYELRDTGTFGFLLPADQVKPTCVETAASWVAMFLAIRKNLIAEGRLA